LQLKKADIYKDDFIMLLKGNEQKFVNVQYVDGTAGFDNLLIKTSCYFQEKEVLSFSQKIQMPKTKT
jgi:hypothetical protein